MYVLKLEPISTNPYILGHLITGGSTLNITFQIQGKLVCEPRREGRRGRDRARKRMVNTIFGIVVFFMHCLFPGYPFSSIYTCLCILYFSYFKCFM